MVTIKIISVGKSKCSWVEEGVQEYLQRLKGTFEVELKLVKEDAALEPALEREGELILCDPEGKSMNSVEFAHLMQKLIEKGGARLSFVIGGSDGIPPHLKTRGTLVSFSKMTFPHEMFRLILVEQIYRSSQILKGTAYHK